VRVEFVRTGGFAGMRLAADIDTDLMEPAEAQTLRELLERSRFFELPTGPVSPPPGPDRFEYQIRVESQTLGSHAITVHEAAVPERLRPLLDRLTLIAINRGAPPGPSADSVG
jgi:hypothetical protein